MLSDLGVELVRIRNEVTDIIRDANPTLDIGGSMILATVGLGVIEKKIRGTSDLEERRKLINEFWTGRRKIEKVVQGYRKTLRHGALHTEQEPRRAVP